MNTPLSKVIEINFNLNETSKTLLTKVHTGKQFNTADTDAWFEFGFTDANIQGGSYNLTLINLKDESKFEHEGIAFSSNPFYYKLDSGSDMLTNEIKHAGTWIGQLVVTLSNGNSATQQFMFEIESHILDGTVASVTMLDGYNVLMTQIQNSKDLLDQYNIEYAALLADLEAIYNSRLFSVETQLADIETEKIGGNVLASMDNLGQDIKTAITGGSVAVIGGESVGYNNFSRVFKEGFGVLVQNFDAWSQGYYNHKSGVFYPESSDQKYLTLNCVEGDRFKFTLRPNTTSVAALIVKNAGGAIIAYLNSATEYTDYEYVVPANATTITFQRTYGTNKYPYSLFKFTFTNMARQDDMIDATSKITQIRSSIYGFDYEEVDAVYTTGYQDANGKLWPAADEYLITEIACVPGEKFKISAVIAVTTVPLILAYNDAFKLSTVTGSTSYTDYEYTVPDYTTKIIVNVKRRSGATNYAYSVKKQVDVDYVQKLVPLIKNVPQNHIICPGDSLTAGANTTADAYKYPQYLQTLITDGSVVHNFGVGGEASPSIAMRQGGLPLFVKPFTIPATVTATEINLYNDINVAVTLALQGRAGLNPVTINGVQGAISYTSSKFYFTRSATGAETVVARPSRVITSGMGYKGGTLVIWSGTNDSYGVTDAIVLANTLIKSSKTMIDYNGTNRYIVIGLISKNYCSVVADVNVLLAKEFGNHFLDIRKYLLDYGLSDVNFTPTAQDTTDIANGEIPTSLRSDSVHLNDLSYPIVAQQTYKKGIELDYWE